MKRASAIILAVAGAVFAAARSATGNPLDALLASAISAPASVSYAGVVEVVRLGDHDAEASVYRIEHRAPDLTRRTYTAPGFLWGEEVVSKNGSTFSVEPRRRRIVERRDELTSDAGAAYANFGLLRENYREESKGSEVFDGRRTTDLALINRYTGRKTVLMRIDAATKLVLDRQEFAPDGALVSEMRFEQISYPASVSFADFQLPQNYEVVQSGAVIEALERPQRAVSDAGFPAREPQTLPEGFAPVEGDLVAMRGVRTLHLLYSDGIRTVSLFENVTASALDTAQVQPRWIRIAGHAAEYAEEGATAIIAWTDGSLHYTLVGEDGLIDLRRIAEAIAS